MPKKPSTSAAKRGEATPTREAIISLGENDFEKSVAENLNEPALARIRKCQTLRGKRFILRCFVIPPVSACFVFYLKKQFPTPPYFIHEQWSYILAQSRTIREMVFRKELVYDNSDPPTAELLFGEDRYDYWLARFDRWRRAVDRSFWFCLERKRGVLNYRDRLVEPAALGAIQYLWAGLPAPMLGRIAHEMRRRSTDESRVFHQQAAQPASVKWLDPELDLWLIEVWPLVVGYDWTYRDVWRVAKEKFPDTADKSRPALASAEALSNHCKMKGLDLRLSPKAKERGGRPRGASTERGNQALPPMADLALQIDGFRSPGVTAAGEEIRVSMLTEFVTG